MGKRGPSVFNVLTILTNEDGSLQWQRVDSYKVQGGPELPPLGGSSAGEWGFITAEGDFVVVADDDGAGGIALIKLVPRQQGQKNLTSTKRLISTKTMTTTQSFISIGSRISSNYAL